MIIDCRLIPNFQHVRAVLMVSLLVMGLVGNLPYADGAVDTEKGKTSYQTFCSACHGSQGKGDGPAGKSLTPPPADLTKPLTRDKSDKELLKIIQNGKPGTAMPPWKQSLSLQQIQEVLAYIRSLK